MCGSLWFHNSSLWSYNGISLPGYILRKDYNKSYFKFYYPLKAFFMTVSPPPESPPYWPCPSASWEQCLSDLRRCLSGYSPHSAPNQTTHNSHVVLFFKCKAVSIPHYYDPHSQPCLLPSLSGYKDEMLGLVLNYSNSSEGFIQNAYVPREIGLNKLN